MSNETRLNLGKTDKKLDTANRKSNYSLDNMVQDNKIPQYEDEINFVNPNTKNSIPGIPETASSSSMESFTPMDFQLYKLIGLFLESKGMQFSNDFLMQLTDLSLTYFHDLINTLQMNTEAQRRRSPSFGDIKVSFRLKNVKPNELFKQYSYNKNLSADIKDKLNRVRAKSSKILEDLKSNIIEDNDPSLPFFTNENYEISELVPNQSHRPSYIPEYLPDLPPDYTYQNTAEYSNTLTDMKKLRIKLVEESRLTEKSLYNLIEDDEHKWKKDFESQINDIEYESDSNDSIMSNVEKNSITDVESPNFDNLLETKNHGNSIPNEIEKSNQESKPSLNDHNSDNLDLLISIDTKQSKDTTKFDFENYAKKRAQIKLQKKKELEKKREERSNNIFMKAEKYYSPYQTLPVTEQVENFFADSLKDEFKNVLKAIRIAEKKKKKKIEKLLKERAKAAKEKESQQDKVEFGFNFNNINHMLDDESDDELIDHDMLNFGDEKEDNNATNNFSTQTPEEADFIKMQPDEYNSETNDNKDTKIELESNIPIATNRMDFSSEDSDIDEFQFRDI